ncbi:hypothetical protein N7457_009074 [Penicillium paradoxum]|uniref:uncharacterized protein n=1 Tax=Penicillium paradoxum TaxID=176176 RepID=UPI0025487CEA|nr:uncharacterized protein N7457_009074 [Penicillium paradoxum]KAJ5774178.1 hypothetical protein N7457_009074 [Penicillium paradoxum]
MDFGLETMAGAKVAGEDPTSHPVLLENASQRSVALEEQILSTFERVITTNAPIFESLLLQIPTDTIIKLYHTSNYLRTFLRSYPTAWKSLSFRLPFPSGTLPNPQTNDPNVPEIVPARQSRPYALDMFLMNVVIPFSGCLKSLELDNTAISGENLTSTVLHSRRETLEHLSVRGCKNVSLKYHIVPFLTMFALQCDIDIGGNTDNYPGMKRLALKSLYAYRCRHHRRRPYLSASLMRKDADAESTHELVNICHKLGIWTDTAWCTTPAGRCARRAGYVKSRFPHGAGSPEVWVVFDRLWRSKNWIGPADSEISSSRICDGKLWENRDTGCYGEALGTGEGIDWGEGKMTPSHLRQSHTQFIDRIRCDNCLDDISERCEHCSVLMHCVGCRKTLCASCAHERPYLYRTPPSSSEGNQAASGSFWWAPGATHSPGSMQDPMDLLGDPNQPQTTAMDPLPILNFHWCCTKPDLSGGGGISIGPRNREVDQVRAVPLPRGQGWEDLEYTVSEWSKTFPKYAYGDPSKPDYSLQTGHLAMMKWLLGPPNRQVSPCPRNLCQGCYDSPQWKVHCKSCSKPLCIEHDLRGLRLRICGYRDLETEKQTIQNRFAVDLSDSLASSQLLEYDLPFRSQHPLNATNKSLIDDSRQHSMDEENTPESHPSDQSALLSFFSNQPTRSFSAPASDHSSPLHRHLPPPSLIRRLSSPYDGKVVNPSSVLHLILSRESGMDPRPRCPSSLRECTGCKVYVCADCIETHPPCKCSYCEENYLCPNCMADRPRDSLCHRNQEAQAQQRERKWKKDMQALEAILELKVANELAEFAGEFFDLVEQPNRLPSNGFPSATTDDDIADLYEGDLAAAEISASYFEPDDIDWFLEDSH